MKMSTLNAPISTNKVFNFQLTIESSLKITWLKLNTFSLGHPVEMLISRNADRLGFYTTGLSHFICVKSDQEAVLT